jgi:hypothetical protein
MPNQHSILPCLTHDNNIARGHHHWDQETPAVYLAVQDTTGAYVICPAQELQLGPNGGLVYCIDYLKENMDWLKEALAPLEKGQDAVRMRSLISCCLSTMLKARLEAGLQWGGAP